jgi:hypothetical protein
VPSIATLVDEGDTLIQTGAVSDRIAALVVLGLLQQIRRYIQLHPRPARSDGKPRLIIVIDEAHRLVPPLGRAGASETNADAVAFAAQMLVNFLTEIGPDLALDWPASPRRRPPGPRGRRRPHG